MTLDEELLEKAYNDIVLQRITPLLPRYHGGFFNQKRFKCDVEEYYAIETTCLEGFSFCHVLGRVTAASRIKATPMIPKNLSVNEVTHILGYHEQVNVFADCQSGKAYPFTLSIHSVPFTLSHLLCPIYSLPFTRLEFSLINSCL